MAIFQFANCWHNQRVFMGKSPVEKMLIQLNRPKIGSWLEGSKILRTEKLWQNIWLVGGWMWLTYPSDKWWSESQWLFPTEWKNSKMFRTTYQMSTVVQPRRNWPFGDDVWNPFMVMLGMIYFGGFPDHNSWEKHIELGFGIAKIWIYPSAMIMIINFNVGDGLLKDKGIHRFPKFEKLRLSHKLFRQSPCVPKKKHPPTEDQWISGDGLASQMAFTCFALLLVPGRAHQAQRAIRESENWAQFRSEAAEIFLGVAIVFPAKHLKSSYWKPKEILVGGIPTPLKNDGVKVSWDDDIPNWMESHNPAIFQATTNQKYQFNLLPGSTWYLPSRLSACNIQSATQKTPRSNIGTSW